MILILKRIFRDLGRGSIPCSVRISFQSANMHANHLLLEEPIRMASILEPSRANFFPATTKIVGTLGPRSRSVEVISGCLKAGMSGVMLDTVGHELQVVNTIEKTISLEEDGKVVLTPHNGQEASPEVLPINFFGLAKRTLSALKLPRAVVANELSSSISVDECPSIDNSERTDGGAFDGSASHIQNNGRRRQKVQDPARDLSIQVLEKFSRVTRFSRKVSDIFGTNERRTHNLTPHDYPSNMASNDVEKVTEQIPVTKDPLEGKHEYWKRNDEAEAATNVGTFELINFKEDYREHNDDTTVHFEVIMSEENLIMAKQEGLLKKFKLTTTINTSNMHLFDPKGVIKKYETPEQKVPARAVAAAAVARALAGLPSHQRYSLPSSSEELSSIYGSKPHGQVVEELEEEFYEEVVDAYALIRDVSGLAEKIQSFFMQEVLSVTHSVLKNILQELLDFWYQVMTNQEAVECIRNIKDAKAAAKHLTC
ncbi:unnamed protein product [Camellia sinensis]